MDTTIGRQWSVFYAYTAWSVVLVLVMVPLGIILFLDANVSALLATEPITTAVLIAQIALGAWSGWRALEGGPQRTPSLGGTAGGSAGWARFPRICPCSPWPPPRH